MRLRVDTKRWAPFSEALLARRDVESAGVLYAEVLETDGGPVLAVREATVVPDEGYRIRTEDRLQLDPVALNRMIRPARERGRAVFTVHTHPSAATPWFSWADDRGDDRLMPSIAAQIPHVPHGSVVMVPGGATAARAFRARSERVEVELVRVGHTLERAPIGSKALGWFDRQVDALGVDGHARLQALTVGVVGLGGVGSLVSAQLAHLGVGDLVLVDGDRLEPSNVSRVLGATTADASSSWSKVDIAARYIDQLGLPVSVRRVPSHLIGEAQLRVLRGCDVIFSCVDRHTPRALLNRLAYQALIPVVDLGVGFRVDPTKRLVGDAGRVVVVGPGRPCMACWGILNPAQLQLEALANAERQRLVAEGYVRGADTAQPSVICFNAMVAGAGVVELLRLAAGFADSEETHRLAFTFSTARLRHVRLPGESRCRICQGGAHHLTNTPFETAEEAT